eukprot:42179_1
MVLRAVLIIAALVSFTDSEILPRQKPIARRLLGATPLLFYQQLSQFAKDNIVHSSNPELAAKLQELYRCFEADARGCNINEELKEGTLDLAPFVVNPFDPIPQIMITNEFQRKKDLDLSHLPPSVRILIICASELGTKIKRIIGANKLLGLWTLKLQRQAFSNGDATPDAFVKSRSEEVKDIPSLRAIDVFSDIDLSDVARVWSRDQQFGIDLSDGHRGHVIEA